MTKLIKLLSIISLILTITACSNNQTVSNPGSPASESQQTETPQQKELVKFTYTVTQINGSEYYGEASDGTGIYFTSENIQSSEINVNDQIIAFFEPENIVDGLVKVEKGIKVEDGSIVPESFYK
ncbi:hypothetical protein [Metabacillus arenae]|uniref:Lipoprotein n=1 Tax=Metabacillus arenae TaxID=2771434 RepID=A0A926NE52_9BACI|nr:hypothetical protein [Metabacillus arenae]MBD1379170.1 hypothetical protein [Metabacillus arenae]